MIKILLVILSFVNLSFGGGKVTELLEKNVTSDSTRRILYGDVADPADFKFVVRIHKGDMLCAGTIISGYYILTAGHCVRNHECSSIEIFPSNWVRGTTSRVHLVQCYVHEKYTGRFLYDIALIRTLDDLLGDDDFGSILLPEPYTVFSTDTPAVVAGWGKREERDFPAGLYRADVRIDDWDTCNYKYKQSHPSCFSETNCNVPDIPRRGICSKGLDSKATAICDGDSGGPLVINGVLAGVNIAVIWGPDNECVIGSPSLHLKVTEFLPWIYNITEPDRDTSSITVIEEPY